jgi:protein-tyrosine phosphatase
MKSDDSLDEVAVRQRLTCGRDGRTGLFMAYLAKRCLGLSGAEALQWVRRFIPRAVETPEQQQLVLHEEVL